MSIVHEDADLLHDSGNLAGAIARDAGVAHSGSEVDFSLKNSKRTTAAELKAAVEHYITAGESDGPAAFRALVGSMKAAKDASQFEELAAALRLALTPTLDFTSVQSLNRLYKALPPVIGGRSKIVLAILGGFTTHQLRDLIELYLFAAGVSVEIYEAEYGVFRQEILDSNSKLYESKPNVVYLATHWRNLGHLPALSNSPQEV